MSNLLKSRKFYALVLALVASYAAFALGDITHAEAARLAWGALMAYIGATALEDGLRRSA
jgi:hypothetical protein